jgi:membrane-bound lytic murein transglycosylase A
MFALSDRPWAKALFSRSTGRGLASTLALLLGLAACTTPQPLPSGVPVESRPVPTTATSPASPAASSPLELPPGTLRRPGALWLPAQFGDLPGWGQDKTTDWLPALSQSCQRGLSTWASLCADLKRLPPTLTATDANLRQWLEQRLRVYRVESQDGDATGLMTGYFEPQIEASRKPSATRRIPLYGPPADLASRKPYWTRQQIDSPGPAQAALRGREIAWVEDPLDALVLQIQGSGRLRITEADGSSKLVRLAFAGHNDQPYKSIGRWLIDQGELQPGEASWPGIKDWARRNPARLNEMLWQNPRVVFFKEEPLPDPALGPKGAMGVPLTPGRSVAVDPQSIPYGTPLWLDSTEPLSPRPLQRLVLAQDTGSAITGAVRVDYFWGWGEAAEANAGRTKQALRVWVLWPKG